MKSYDGNTLIVGLLTSNWKNNSEVSRICCNFVDALYLLLFYSSIDKYFACYSFIILLIKIHFANLFHHFDSLCASDLTVITLLSPYP